MDVKATAKYIKISPKKIRQVIALFRGMDVVEAINYLKFIQRRAGLFILEVLKSAVANAEHNFNLKKDNLYIKEIFVNEGPTLKRWRARAFGRAAPIRKRSSHLVVVLSEKIPTIKDKPAVPKIKKAVLQPAPKEKEKPAKKVSKRPLSKEEKREVSKTKGQQIFDVRRKAGRRTKQHLDKVRTKKAGGVLKRMFRRKSI